MCKRKSNRYSIGVQHVENWREADNGMYNARIFCSHKIRKNDELVIRMASGKRGVCHVFKSKRVSGMQSKFGKSYGYEHEVRIGIIGYLVRGEL